MKLSRIGVGATLALGVLTAWLGACDSSATPCGIGGVLNGTCQSGSTCPAGSALIDIVDPFDMCPTEYNAGGSRAVCCSPAVDAVVVAGDAGNGSTPDSTTMTKMDSTVTPDSTTGTDAGQDVSTGTPDSNPPPVDTGTPDTAPPVDTGTDTGPADSGHPDAGTDAATDAGHADAATDGGADAAADAGQCTTDLQCSGATPACDITTHACVACTALNKTSCTGTTPVCDTTTNKCAPCTGDSDCAGLTTTPACNTTTGACVACTSTNSTACTVAAPACDTTTNTCVACTSDTNCTSVVLPACDTTTHVCGVCSSTNASLCTGLTPVCSNAGTDICVACNVDGDCPALTPTCTAHACL